jgi:hypothetical protein
MDSITQSYLLFHAIPIMNRGVQNINNGSYFGRIIHHSRFLPRTSGSFPAKAGIHVAARSGAQIVIFPRFRGGGVDPRLRGGGAPGMRKCLIYKASYLRHMPRGGYS